MSTGNFLQKMNIKQKIMMMVVMISVLILSASLLVAISGIKTNLLEANKGKTKSIVETAYKIIESYQEQAQNGELSVKEAQELALKRIDKMRYDGANYLWVTAYNDEMLAHPKLAGKSISDVADKGQILPRWRCSSKRKR